MTFPHILPSLTVGSLLTLASCGMEQVENPITVDGWPTIYPDYVGVTIPCNISPLNFTLTSDSVERVDVVIGDASGPMLHAQGVDNTDIDPMAWQQMVAAHVGDSLQVQLSARLSDGRWRRYASFPIYVSADSIDYGICYRLIEPGYVTWSKMGIYEYALATGQQSAVIENTQFQGCVNCHSFSPAHPADMSLHIRGPHGATLLRKGGSMQALNTKTDQTLGFCVYPYWHPQGRYIAYSTNTTRQVFHIQQANRIEVFDSASDVQVLDTETGTLLAPAVLRTDSLMETFPAFTPDGRTLLFCASSDKSDQPQQVSSIRYNLYGISFDPETGTFGDSIRLLLDAVSMGKSVTMPRPSYDGRHLVYTMADYGQFPIWHHEADLYIIALDSLLAGGHQGRPMTEANSDDTESYHSWSSNSRWMVFSSRRDDGLFTRPYFTHVDAEGQCTKAFMLPQAEPRRWYSELFRSYNVPEFIRQPVALDRNAAVELINNEHRESLTCRP